MEICSFLLIIYFNFIHLNFSHADAPLVTPTPTNSPISAAFDFELDCRKNCSQGLQDLLKPHSPTSLPATFSLKSLSPAAHIHIDLACGKLPTTHKQTLEAYIELLKQEHHFQPESKNAVLAGKKLSFFTKLRECPLQEGIFFEHLAAAQRNLDSLHHANLHHQLKHPHNPLLHFAGEFAKGHSLDGIFEFSMTEAMNQHLLEESLYLKISKGMGYLSQAFELIHAFEIANILGFTSFDSCETFFSAQVYTRLSRHPLPRGLKNPIALTQWWGENLLFTLDPTILSVLADFEWLDTWHEHHLLQMQQENSAFLTQLIQHLKKPNAIPATCNNSQLRNFLPEQKFHACVSALMESSQVPFLPQPTFFKVEKSAPSDHTSVK